MADRGEFVGTVVEQEQRGVEYQSTWLRLTDEGTRCFGLSRAGQFLQVACRDLGIERGGSPLLRRPFGIAGLRYQANSKAKLEVNIIYQILGPGTQYLAKCPIGQKLDILGPLGTGFSTAGANERVLLVGGGVGLGPLVFLAAQLRQTGVENVVAIIGGRSAQTLVGKVNVSAVEAGACKAGSAVEDFAASGVSSIVATDDGSVGYHGNVVNVLEAFLRENGQWASARVCTCGPEGMLKAVAEFTAKAAMVCEVCVEAYMACGIGVCQSCVVDVKDNVKNCGCGGQEGHKYKLACTDGPVFDARQVVW